jgi:hypothetical protein
MVLAARTAGEPSGEPSSVGIDLPRPLAKSCDECVELAPHPGRGEMVEVVSRADDLAVADPEHEDARQCDAGLPEVYALLVGVSQAAAREHPGEQVRAQMLTTVFDGLAPRL